MLAMITILVSCSQVRNQPVNPVLVAPAGDTSPVTEGDIKAVYPHTAAFKTSALHGQKYLAKQNTCKVCHGNDLAGGSARVSCSSCHSTYPHNPDFIQKTHGATYLKDSKSCTTCHGKDYAGGDSGKSCKTCHSNFPHPEDWDAPENHGAHYLAEFGSKVNPSAHPKQSAVDCQSCHAKKGKSPAVFSCDDCHTKVPHADEGFVMGNHGKEAGAGGSNCTDCHKDFKRLMPDFPKGCAECHSDKIKDGHWTKP